MSATNYHAQCKSQPERNCANHEKLRLAPKVDTRLARQASKQDLQIINTFFNVKNTIFHSFSLQTPTQSLTPPPLPPTTTEGHHDPLLLATEPPYQEDCLNWSWILKIHLSQPTSRRDDERKIDKTKRSSPREKMSRVSTNVYLRKTLGKPKRGLQILKIMVQELFTHREGISTPRARHKGWQPLIECAKRDFKIIYFPFLYFLTFLGSTRRLPLLLHILWCDEEFRPT